LQKDIYLKTQLDKQAGVGYWIVSRLFGDALTFGVVTPLIKNIFKVILSWFIHPQIIYAGSSGSKPLWQTEIEEHDERLAWLLSDQTPTAYQGSHFFFRHAVSLLCLEGTHS